MFVKTYFWLTWFWLALAALSIFADAEAGATFAFVVIASVSNATFCILYTIDRRRAGYE